ncbi:hypothetical protein [Streptomyces griseosporeus]|uniref:hypothetical protein n=1 Tax=Streptomyces griseosporeus TaxID=1910 RepID=UPI0036F7A52F
MDIGRELARLRKRLEAVERAARLSHASIEDTSLQVYDGNGSLRGLIGLQADGTTAVNIVNGPPPPQPSQPIISSVLGGVTASWDGTFTDGSTVPLDWQRLEVHAATTSSFTPDASTLHGTIESPQGGTVVIVTDTPVYVRLLARTTSGTPSTPSDQAGPLGPTPVVADDIVDGIVTTLKLADDAVTQAKLAAAAVGSAELQTGAVDVGKIAAGAVLMNTLGGPLGDLASQRYADYFRDPAAWAQLSASSGGAWAINPAATDTPSGGGKLIVTGDVQLASTTLIPQDTDTLYRVMVRARATAQDPSGAATVYIGVVGVAEDGVTLVNRAGVASNTTQHYCCTSGGSLGTADGWKTYVGWIQGHSATGQTAPAGPATDPRSPEVTHADVRYLRPMVWLNFGKSTAAVMEVEAVTVEAVRTGTVGSTNLISGSVTAGAIAADAVTAGKVAADAITTRELAAGSVTTAKLVAGAIQTAQLDTGAVNADKIASAAVTTAKLDALAVTADKIATNAITAGKIAAGAVDATAIAADAITGKTITGGTVTGALIQTAATGERITLNESGANKVLVYNTTTSSAIAELSARGLLVQGTAGATLWLNPSTNYPQFRLYNPTSTNNATIQLAETSPGEANLEQFCGKFSGNGYTDMVWRTYLANDYAVIERLRSTAPSTSIGGRLFLNPTYANLGFKNTDDPTQDTGLTITPNLVTLNPARLAVTAPASSNSALYVNAATGHTGNLLRLGVNGVDKAVVDKDGNFAITGFLQVAGVGQRQFKRRSSDLARASTTTLTADTQLTFAVDANATYVLDGFLIYSGPGDFQMGWSVPSGTAGMWTGIGNGGTVVSANGSGGTQTDAASTWGYTVKTEAGDLATTRSFGGVAANVFAVQVRATIRVGATAGNVTLTWAQGVSNATATTLYTDSHLRLEKVA